MAESSCPPPEQYNQMFGGSLPDKDFASLTDHLETCPNCAETVRNLNSQDTIEAALRLASVFPVETECDVVSRLIAELSAVPWRGDRGDRKHSGVAQAEDTTGADAESDVVSAVIEQLEPAEHEGELGNIGAYRIVRVIGLGGMGVVFEAEDAQLGRRVALKVMTPATARMEFARERFVREARSIAAIYQDHIVPIHQVNAQHELPFIVMPLLRGESLAERLSRRGQLEVKDVLRLGQEVADGLAAAHGQRVIHRDIKPANIWLESRPRHFRIAPPPTETPQHSGPESDDERAVILDFGLARPLDDGAALTRTGAMAGTPLYMSPEHARGEQIDGRSDLFSLGAVLYECLTGQLPFEGPNVMASLLASALRKPTPICELREDVPAPVADLVTRLLAKDADDRPDTAEEVAASFRDLRERSTQEHTSGGPSELPPHKRGQHSAKTPWFGSIILGILALAMFAGIVYVAALILRVETPGGTVVLEFDNASAPGAVVSIDDEQEIVVRPEHANSPLRIRVDEGAHQLRIIKDDVELFTKQFQLKAGGSERINVRLEPPLAASNNSDPVEKSQDALIRQAIAWVDSVGGHAHGYLADELVEFHPSHLQFTDRRVSVYRIHFDYKSVKTDQITDENLAHLRAFQSLEMLRLPPTRTLSNACIEHLVGLRKLRGITLNDQPGISDDGAEQLSRMSSLESLDLSGTAVTDAGLQPLAKLKQLRKLDVRNTAVSQAATEELQSQLPNCIVVSDDTGEVFYNRQGRERFEGPHASLAQTVDTSDATIAFSPDGNWLASATGMSPATVRLANLKDPKFQHVTTQRQGYIQLLGFSQDSKRVAACTSTGRVVVFDIDTETGRTRPSDGFQLDTDFATSMNFACDGSLWFAEPFATRAVSIYRVGVDSSQRLATPFMHQLGFSSDGTAVALHRWGAGVVEIRDVDSKKLQQTIRMPADSLGTAHAGAFTGIALSSRGDLLASAGEDGVVRLWDVASGEPLHSMLGHVHFVNRVAFSPDAKLLASSGCDSTVRIWKVATGQLLVSLMGHEHIVPALSISTDGRQIASGSWDGVVKLWNIE